MVAGRQTEELARFAASSGCAYRGCDIRCQESLAALIEETRRIFGGFDIAVNAAGANLVKPFLEVRSADLQRVIDVQFAGTFLFLQAALKRISDGGSIIQISSVSASALLPDHAAYMASKAAGDVLVKAAAVEFGSRGVRINSIAPGPTEDAPMAASVLADASVRAQIASRIPLGRLGTGRDVAAAALWLAGDDCFVTGEVLQVNGGRGIPRLY